MAIGLVDDSEFEREIIRKDNSPSPELKPAQVINIPKPGRSEGDNNVPESLRNIIGEEAVTNGRASALQMARMFDVSPSSVSAYTDGKTSTAAKSRNEKLNHHLKRAKLRLATKARHKLDSALNNITEEKLVEANLKDLALVAKAMSGVIKDMEPSSIKEGGTNINGPSIVLFNPGFTKEEKFETVEVQD